MSRAPWFSSLPNMTVSLRAPRSTSTEEFMQHELIHNNEVFGFDNSGFAERTLPARYGSGVAQISNLLYRRIPFGRTSDDSVTQEISTAGGLEIRDTAGWKPALLFLGPRAPKMNRLGLLAAVLLAC